VEPNPNDRDATREAGGSEHDARRERELVAWLDAHAGSICARCATALCAHELLFASALGHKRAPVCSACAACEFHGASSAAASDVDALRAHLRAHFERRACYGGAWRVADGREPGCALVRVVPAGAEKGRAPEELEPAHETWDAGDLGCGELVLELRVRMRALKAGEVLELVARDPGASEDLPAWCRMTGHELLHARAPRFLLRRRRD